MGSHVKTDRTVHVRACLLLGEKLMEIWAFGRPLGHVNTCPAAIEEDAREITEEEVAVGEVMGLTSKAGCIYKNNLHTKVL